MCARVSANVCARVNANVCVCVSAYEFACTACVYIRVFVRVRLYVRAVCVCVRPHLRVHAAVCMYAFLGVCARFRAWG